MIKLKQLLKEYDDLQLFNYDTHKRVAQEFKNKIQAKYVHVTSNTLTITIMINNNNTNSLSDEHSMWFTFASNGGIHKLPNPYSSVKNRVHKKSNSMYVKSVQQAINVINKYIKGIK